MEDVAKNTPKTRVETRENSMAASPLRACVASTNPVKVGAVQQALAACFPDRAVEVEGCSVPSGVADQPMSDDETKRGAMNRFPVCGERAARARHVRRRARSIPSSHPVSVMWAEASSFSILLSLSSRPGSAGRARGAKERGGNFDLFAGACACSAARDSLVLPGHRRSVTRCDSRRAGRGA